MITFGPVPSRRLGSSLGINHIPPKHCSYSCIYCQVGRTTNMGINRLNFYPVKQILNEVENKISQCSKSGIKIDYLTLVPDGEPTLDLGLGNIINGLKQFEIPIAVISNSSLINQYDVQDELLQADWVSLKVDSTDESQWRKINRPHRKLSLKAILDGMLAFRKRYKGELVTETMLVSGINYHKESIDLLCNFLLELQPFKSYISIPIRPGAEPDVVPPSPEVFQEMLQIISTRIPFMDLLIETEIGDFVSTGNLKDDILSITAVHPLREETLHQMITQAGEDWKVAENLLASGEICSINYRNERYYLRCPQKR